MEGLLAIADLHVEVPENRAFADEIRPERDGDWLIVAGDVGEVLADVEGALDGLAARFEQVVWVPGNHELWTRPDDPATLRGEARYRHIVDHCRALGIVTPEDEFPVWDGPGGPAVVAPLFTLYDGSFLTADGHVDGGVVCSDEVVLFPEPHASVADWCAERVPATRARLEALDPALPTVLVSHFPLIREPTRSLFYPEFARWCGTTATADWHTRFRALAVVYGHLHIPRTEVYDGVRFEEVSIGYPREWRWRGRPPSVRRIL